MSRILFIVFVIKTTIFCQIFVSPEGNDTNPGTIDMPLKTLTAAFKLVKPDSTIYLRGGIYNTSATVKSGLSGSSGKYIKIWAYPGERPVFDFSNQPAGSSNRGFNISNSYLWIKGLEIRYAKDNGMNLSGNYNIIESCIFHHNQDSGFQISGDGAFNKIINCDAFANFDSLTHGENADGFAPKLSIGQGNEFRGCRSWDNADDGWDLYEGANRVTIDSCWAFRNGKNLTNDPLYAGDGNGFKLGGNYIPAPHIITRSVAVDNRVRGFDQNNNTAGVTVFNCTSYRNLSKNYYFSSNPTTGKHIFKNNIGFSGSNTIASSSEQVKNSWQGFSVTGSDFISLDTSYLLAPRKLNGDLPDIPLLHLNEQSPLVNAGIDIGLLFFGNAPDLGAFETGNITRINQVDHETIRFELFNNFPNPFNPSTTITYSLKDMSHIELILSDILGRKLRVLQQGEFDKGMHRYELNLEDLSGGIYIVALNSVNFTKSIKINFQK